MLALYIYSIISMLINSIFTLGVDPAAVNVTIDFLASLCYNNM